MDEMEETGQPVDEAPEPPAQELHAGQGEEGPQEAVAPTAVAASDIVGIRFPNSGKTYCFSAGELDIRRGDRVVVESDLGINIGQVVKTACEFKDRAQKLKQILRKVTQVDLNQEQENEEVRKEARDYAVERIAERKLPMKLLHTEVTLDRKRFIFYFVSETRIDFRELVKDLASKFRSRIELRQIGVRDAARMIGGFGICGQELCCKTWLKSFAPISIKMAKQQDLVLNTCKLSGLCGRLMCCLNYEYEPGAPRRRKPEPRQMEEVSEEAISEAIEAVMEPAGTVVTEAGETEQIDSLTAAPEADAHPEVTGEDGQARKKRRRRGGRKRNKPRSEAQTGGQGSPGGGQPAVTGEARGEGLPSGGERAQTGGQAGERTGAGERPKRPRRRRRKPRGKKEE